MSRWPCILAGSAHFKFILGVFIINFYKRIFVLLLAFFITFNFTYKSVNAEPITIGIGLLYFAVSAVSAGVVYYSVKDIETSYLSYDKSLSASERLAFLNTARLVVGNLIEGKKEDLYNSNLFDFLKEKFLPGRNSFVDSTDILNGEFFKSVGSNNYGLNVGSNNYVGATINGILCTISASPVNGSRPRDFVLRVNGSVLFTGSVVGVYMIHANVSSSGIHFTVMHGADTVPGAEIFVENDAEPYPIPGDTVNYNVSPNSFISSGGVLNPNAVALPGLPYVPGQSVESDDNVHIGFPGDIQSILDNINERDSSLLNSLLDRLLGVDNHALANNPGFTTEYDAENDRTLFPGISIPGVDNPVVPGIDVPGIDIPGIDTPFEGTPVVDVPEHVGGLWGWLYQLLVSILNSIKGILSFLSNLLKSLLKGLLDLFNNLFILRYDIVAEFVTDVSTTLKNKLGTNIYIPFINNLKELKGIPFPDLYIYGSKVVDASFLNSMADTSKLWQRWFYYFLIIFYNLNNVYKLVRNNDIIARTAHGDFKG